MGATQLDMPGVSRNSLQPSLFIIFYVCSSTSFPYWSSNTLDHIVLSLVRFGYVIKVWPKFTQLLLRSDVTPYNAKLYHSYQLHLLESSSIRMNSCLLSFEPPTLITKILWLSFKRFWWLIESHNTLFKWKT